MWFFETFFLIPLTGLRNAKEATFRKVRYNRKENEMIIPKFYIFWLFGDINIRHKINYQLFLIISARNVFIIREYFQSTFLKFTDSAININT
jgi:hypothetical protein